jgi:heme exporter protein A
MTSVERVLLSVNQLSFFWEEKEIIRDLNFSLSAGKLLQVKGPNGVGKTTLLRLLAGFLSPSRGDIHYTGKLAYMGHTPGLTSWLTVEENIIFAAEMVHYPKADLSSRMDQFLLWDLRALFPHQLSVGQKKRLGFALMTLSGANLWLLDEPFASLDAQSSQLIQNIMVSHLHTGGMIVMTTHQEKIWQVAFDELILGHHHGLF